MASKVIYSIILTLLVSCTSEFPETPDRNQGQEQGIPVNFSFTIEPEKDIVSRAIINGTKFNDGEKVGIYALSGQTNTEGNFYPTNATAANKYWDEMNFRPLFINACYESLTTQITVNHTTTTVKKLIPSEGTLQGFYPAGENAALEVYAYYPYQDISKIKYNNEQAKVEPPQIRVEINPEMTEDSAIDYLYTGSVVTTPNDDYATLNFKHALGRLQIYLTTNQDFDAGYCPIIKHVEIRTSYPQKGYMNLATGDITSDATDYNTNADNNWTIYKDTTYPIYPASIESREPVCDYLFIPRQGRNLSYIKLTIQSPEDGQERIFEIKRADIGDVELTKGTVTKLLINYNYDK